MSHRPADKSGPPKVPVYGALPPPSAIRTVARECARSFPGHLDQMRAVRAFLAHFLDDHSATDDAVLLASELAANAIMHSESGRPGGWFAVRAEIASYGYLRAEIEDQGSAWDGNLSDARPYHGLFLLHGIATTCGTHLTHAGRVVWFAISGPATSRQQPGQPATGTAGSVVRTVQDRMPVPGKLTADLAALEMLAAELTARRFHAGLHAPPGRLPLLAVTNPNAPALTENIAVQAGWYWFSFAERIAPCGQEATAAAVIARVLRAPDEPARA